MAKRKKKTVCHAERVQTLLAECVPTAIANLTKLMDAEGSKNPETARKACVDVLKLQLEVPPAVAPTAAEDSGLDSKLAERLLKALAEEANAIAEPRPS